ncbi:P-loop containing nucleoside triphosphate hydrolase protein [Spinellus fusiger]|nr:P-loop containing nucleoside triphosphate hydrolase protein [Spinellus fusiger]
MSLWVDKYRPTTLDTMSYHENISKHLGRLAVSEDMPHTLFYGPSGAGKKTRLTAMLHAIYGPAVEKLKVEQRMFVTTSNRKLNFTVVSSNYHIELNPGDLGIYDHVIIQEVLKDIAQSQQVDNQAKRAFKVVVIDQADSLTRTAQAALRRTMEKYTSSIRLILCCTSLSKVIEPLRSRCLLIRVPRPTTKQVAGILQRVAKEERVSLLETLAVNIAEHHNCNLRASLLALESMASRNDLIETEKVDLMEWEQAISTMASEIIRDQSTEQVLKMRAKLYDFLNHCIDGSTILKCLTFELIKRVDSPMKQMVIAQAAKHEHRMQLGSKDIYHLESYVVSVMHHYKS